MVSVTSGLPGLGFLFVFVSSGLHPAYPAYRRLTASKDTKSDIHIILREYRVYEDANSGKEFVLILDYRDDFIHVNVGMANDERKILVMNIIDHEGNPLLDEKTGDVKPEGERLSLPSGSEYQLFEGSGNHSCCNTGK